MPEMTHMKRELTQNKKSIPTWLRFFIIISLVLGIFFRFVNLDRKLYWYDEAATALRVSGYTWAEFIQQVCDGHEISIEDLQKYQRPNSEKGLIDTVKSLAEEPQHPPLYFIMTRFWMQWFGNSVTVMRSLPALISLLVFPCIYWLCTELFELPLSGWVAVALIAVSPFHLVYAQEAREYSLWTATTLLSSAALLRAMRLKRKLIWGIYAATLVLGVYTYLFSIFVAIGHGIYVIVIERFRLSKTATAYFIALIVMGLSLVPWLGVVIANPNAISKTTSWVAESTSRWSLIKTWFHNIRTLFLDLGIGPYLTPFILILVGYSIYFICRNTYKYTWLFIVALSGVNALVLIVPDLFSGGRLSGNARYLIPCWLGIHLTVAHLLATQITFGSLLLKNICKTAIVTLLCIGVVSCGIISQAEVPFSKILYTDNPQIAHIINQATSPLVVSDNESSNFSLVALSSLLDPKVRFRLVVNPKLLQIPNGFSDVFLFYPSNALRDELEHSYKIEPIHIKNVEKESRLWRLEHRLIKRS